MLTKIYNETDEMFNEYVNDRTVKAIVGCSTNNVWEDFQEYCLEKDIFVHRKKALLIEYLCTKHNLKTKTIKHNGRNTEVLTSL